MDNQNVLNKITKMLNDNEYYLSIPDLVNLENQISIIIQNKKDNLPPLHFHSQSSHDYSNPYEKSKSKVSYDLTQPVSQILTSGQNCDSIYQQSTPSHGIRNIDVESYLIHHQIPDTKNKKCKTINRIEPVLDSYYHFQNRNWNDIPGYPISTRRDRFDTI